MSSLVPHLVRRAVLGVSAACAVAWAPTAAAAVRSSDALPVTVSHAPAVEALAVDAPASAAAATAKRSTKAARRAARRASARRAARRASARRLRSARVRSTARLSGSARAARVGRISMGSATLRGSKAAVDRAYRDARRDGLTFARTRRDVVRGAAEGDYVRLTGTRSYRLKGVAMPYVRPETRAFLNAFAPEYRRACGEQLTVTSAMRPTSVHLRNSVAKTVHPTGIAVDLRTPRNGCRGWMRNALLGYELRGVVEATEEHRPAHFHVAVLRAP